MAWIVEKDEKCLIPKMMLKWNVEVKPREQWMDEVRRDLSNDLTEEDGTEQRITAE